MLVHELKTLPAISLRAGSGLEAAVQVLAATQPLEKVPLPWNRLVDDVMTPDPVTGKENDEVGQEITRRVAEDFTHCGHAELRVRRWPPVSG